jgi:hypothetical protein
MRSLATSWLGLCGLFLARPAFASSHVNAALDMERAAGTEQCIEASALQRAVEARLHRKVFVAPDDAELRIRLALSRSEAGTWSAELSLATAAGVSLGQRSLESSAPHCSALDESLALVIALLVDSPPPPVEVVPPPEAAPAAPEPPIHPGAPAPTPPASTISRPVAPPPATPAATKIYIPADSYAPREPWHADVALGAVAAGGALPGLAFAPELSLGIEPVALPELRVFGGVYGNRETHVGESGAGARFGLAYVGLETCPWSVRRGAARPFFCLGEVVGHFRATAFGFDQNSSATLVRFALHARLGLSLPLTGALSARLDGRAEAPVTRNVFVYGARDGHDAGIYQASLFSGSLELGLAFAWR